MTSINLLKRKPIHGVGINDSDYKTQTCKRVNGVLKREWICPYYSVWKDMLMRCYSQKYQIKNPTYFGCIVCEEWLKFSCFKSWMQNCSWEGNVLDKDIILSGNKIYGPKYCLFIPSEVNQLAAALKTNKAGVRKQGKKFYARISVKGKGLMKSFYSLEEAIVSWRQMQVERVKEYINKYGDSEVIVSYLQRILLELEIYA